MDVHGARPRDGAGLAAPRLRRHPEGARRRPRAGVQQLAERDVQVALVILMPPYGRQVRPGEDRRRVRRLDGHPLAAQQHGDAGRIAQRVLGRRRITQPRLGVTGDCLFQSQRQHLARERHLRHRDRANRGASAYSRRAAVTRGHPERAARRHRGFVQGAGQLDGERLPVHLRGDLEQQGGRRRGARRMVAGPRVGVAHRLVGEARHLGVAGAGALERAGRCAFDRDRRLGLVVAHLVRVRAGRRGELGQPERHGCRPAARGRGSEVRAVDIDGPGLGHGTGADVGVLEVPVEVNRHDKAGHRRAGERRRRLRLRGPGAEQQGERRGGQARRRAPPAREPGGPEKPEAGRRGRRSGERRRRRAAGCGRRGRPAGGTT